MLVLAACDNALHICCPDWLVTLHGLGTIALCILVDESKRYAEWVVTGIRKARVERCFNFVSEFIVQWLVQELCVMQPIIVSIKTLRFQMAKPLSPNLSSYLLEGSILIDAWPSK